MTKTKKIKKLIKEIDKKKPGEEDIKIFSSTIIEMMVQAGVPPRVRRDFLKKTKNTSIDIEKVVKIIEKSLILMA
jgi:hypothetical protein